MKRNAGFTLIELVIVIIVLGILAATAVPKFINLQDDARASAVKGVEGAIHSAANIVYARAAIDGDEAASSATVTVSGTDVSVVYGYPAATSSALSSSMELSGFTIDGGATTSATGGVAIWADGSSSAGDSCLVYTQATSAAGYTLLNTKFDATTAGQCGS